jgi:NAD(P)H-hydrate epimerase
VTTHDDTRGALTPEELRAYDRLAIEEVGLPGAVLMENAGAGAAALALALGLAHCGPRRAARVEVLCGPGQNGGDGWVVARRLSAAGHGVHVTSTLDPAHLRGDAALHARAALALGLAWERVPGPDAGTDGAARLRARLAACDVAVDALLGTGSAGAPRGAVALAIEALVAAAAQDPRPWILALDLPSGLDPRTGSRPGPCVRADLTATFVARKTGFLAPGAAACLGRVEVVDLGLSASLIERARAAVRAAASLRAVQDLRDGGPERRP